MESPVLSPSILPPRILPRQTPPLIPPITFLPASILDRDTLLLDKLLRHLWSSPGLCHGERLVLGAVFQHMPLIDNDLGELLDTTLSLVSASKNDCHYIFYDRILHLPVDQLKLMAKLFTAALTGARSWGGSARKSEPGTWSPPTPLTSLGQLSDPIIDYDSLFSTLQIHPFPDMANPADHDDDDDTRAKGKGKATPRPVYQKRACFDRQLQSCAITGGQSNLQHAHIIPYSIVSLAASDGSKATLFWMALAIILGPSLRDTVFSIVGAGENFYNTTNSIALVSGLHGHLDTGQLHLIPEVGAEAFEPSRTRQLDITICWWGSLLDLALISTARPINPDDQVRLVSNNSSCNAPPVIPTRAVAEGDRFRLFTNNPEKQPLPHPLLLGIHTMLWRMIATAGMAETTLSKKRRHVDAVDCSGPKRAKRGGGGGGKRRGTGGRRGGDGSARSQGARNDDPSLDGKGGGEIQPNQEGASEASTDDLVDEDGLSYSRNADHYSSDNSPGPDSDNSQYSSAGRTLDSYTRTVTDSSQRAMPSADLPARLPHGGQELLPLNNLQLAWIGFRLKFGSRREDSVEDQSLSESDTPDCDEEYSSEQDVSNEEGESDEEYTKAKATAKTKWSEAIMSRTGAAWKVRMQRAAAEKTAGLVRS